MVSYVWRGGCAREAEGGNLLRTGSYAQTEPLSCAEPALGFQSPIVSSSATWAFASDPREGRREAASLVSTLQKVLPRLLTRSRIFR